MSLPNIRQEIQNHRWYHSIPLGNGLFTPGKRSYEHLSSRLKMMQLPEDLSGWSVLDVGCNEGFFAIEAKKRGAARVVAIDKRSAAADRFSLVKGVLGCDVEFRIMDVYDLSEDTVEPADMVFFLSVLHHLERPRLALDKIASVTTRVAIIEVPVIVTECGRDGGTLASGLSNKGRPRLFPDRRFLLEMLQASGFRDVQIMGSYSRHRYPGTPADAEKLVLKAYK